MTITELIQSGLPWPELRDKLVAYPYGKKTYTKNLLDDGDFHQPGTWDEVRRARNFGLITDAQYMEVVNALAAKADG